MTFVQRSKFIYVLLDNSINVFYIEGKFLYWERSLYSRLSFSLGPYDRIMSHKEVYLRLGKEKIMELENVL
jgi:hypothetical protein